MKKLFLILVAVIGLTTVASAQENALGVRIGYGAAVSTELSFQSFLSDINRIELDLGFRLRKVGTEVGQGNNVQVVDFPSGAIFTGIYQWHWYLAGGFGFFGGPALQLSLPDWANLGLAVGGQVGFDYQFDAPFQIGFDFRPLYNVLGRFKGIKENDKTRIVGGFDPNFALSLRYAF